MKSIGLLILIFALLSACTPVQHIPGTIEIMTPGGVKSNSQYDIPSEIGKGSYELFCSPSVEEYVWIENSTYLGYEVTLEYSLMTPEYFGVKLAKTTSEDGKYLYIDAMGKISVDTEDVFDTRFLTENEHAASDLSAFVGEREIGALAIQILAEHEGIKEDWYCLR